LGSDKSAQILVIQKIKSHIENSHKDHVLGDI